MLLTSGKKKPEEGQLPSRVVAEDSVFGPFLFIQDTSIFHEPCWLEGVLGTDFLLGACAGLSGVNSHIFEKSSPSERGQ